VFKKNNTGLVFGPMCWKYELSNLLLKGGGVDVGEVLNILDEAYALGQEAKAQEIREVLGVKE
jgi:hypothetical protein